MMLLGMANQHGGSEENMHQLTHIWSEEAEGLNYNHLQFEKYIKCSCSLPGL